MPTLPLQCSNCNLTITLQTETTLGNYLLEHYGTIDKVQGKLFEIPCPLCIGVMEKQDEMNNHGTHRKKNQTKP